MNKSITELNMRSELSARVGPPVCNLALFSLSLTPHAPVNESQIHSRCCRLAAKNVAVGERFSKHALLRRSGGVSTR